MTKQEEIREWMAIWLAYRDGVYDSRLASIYDPKFARYFEQANDILFSLHSQGVVIKVDGEINGNLTNELYDAMEVAEEAECKLLIKQALNTAGYASVESLIREVNDEEANISY